MKFLLHTVVQLEGKFVYYNVYRVSPDEYFFEVLDNPNRITCTNFTFHRDSEQCSISLSDREKDGISELLRTATLA
jgi:hypothetical protein